jgi:aromatic-L-amino-acid decarboxylase
MPPSLAELRAACAEPYQVPDAAGMRAEALALVDFAVADFAALEQTSPSTTATRSAMEALLREPVPEEGAGFDAVLRLFQRDVLPNNTRAHHPRFLAFVPSAPTWASVLGDWLCSATNVFAGVWTEAAAATEVELLVLDWFKSLMNYPAAAGGLLTSGGSEANLTALVAARARLPQEGRERAVLYVSEQRHWSIDRAARIMGLRADQLRILPVDSDFRLTPAACGAAVSADRHAGLRPWLLVANAGATNTGACDPLDELADVCRAQELWLHVDAAYGWPGLLSDWTRHDLHGIERADSVTLDPHKWLAQTYELGCVLLRHGALLEQAFSLRPEYMQDVQSRPDEPNFADRGIALTRRFRALKLWLSLKVLGLAWHRGLVEHCCRLAALTEALLRQRGCFEVLSPPRLSTICFRYVPRDDSNVDDVNRALCAELCARGRAFVATTQLRGATALRLCFVNWRTRGADVEEVLDLMEAIGARLGPVPRRAGAE